VSNTSATATAGSVVCARPAGVDSVFSLVAPLDIVRDLSPSDPLFVAAFVAALCFAIAGFVTVAAPAALPRFVAGLVNAFLLFGALFLVLGAAGALLVALRS
jgi:hypothetical protein